MNTKTCVYSLILILLSGILLIGCIESEENNSDCSGSVYYDKNNNRQCSNIAP